MHKNHLFLSPQQLREARLRRGWSQQELADQVDTTVVTVKRWERGAQTPSPHFRFKLSALFGKESEQFFHDARKAGEIPVEIPLAVPSTSQTILSASNAGMEEISLLETSKEAPFLEETLSSVTDTDVFAARNMEMPSKKTPFPQRTATRRAIVTWGGIGLTTALAISGGFYWFTRPSSSLSDAHLSSPIYTYSAPTAKGIFDVKWSPQGDFLACVNGNTLVQVITVLPTGYRLTHTGFAVNCLTWSPQGSQLASPGQDQQIHIWDPLNNMDALRFSYPSTIPECISWSPDGTRLALCGSRGFLGIWDATTGRPLLSTPHQKGILWWVDWSPDSTRLATAGSDGLVDIWDATTGNIVLTYSGHRQAVQDIQWSPSSKYLVSASKDKTVHVWDAQTGQTLLVYTKHLQSVQAAAWSPNEQVIASGSADTTIHVWHAKTGKDLVSYSGHTSTVWTLAWSPDGHALASASQDGTMHVWPFHMLP